MKILSFSLDKIASMPSSSVARRLQSFSDIVDQLDVLVPSDEEKTVNLSEKVIIHGVSGSKAKKFLKIFFKGKSLIKEQSYDLITVQDTYYLGFLALCLSRLCHLPLQVQVHGFEKYSGLRKILARYVISRANSIRVVSQRLKRWIQEEVRVPVEKISIVPVYADLVSNNVSRVPHEDFVFLIVARLEPIKNISLALLAMKEIYKKYPNAKLYIVGNGSEREKLSSLTKALHLEGVVTFLGHLTSVGEMYAKTDALLITSLSEGWGLVAVEAAQYGLPVIMTDVGLAHEFIKEGKNGLVVPVNDKAALVEAMEKLMSDEDLARELGENNRKMLETLPTKEETLRLYREGFEKAIQ